MICLEHVSKSFESKPIVRNLNLTVSPGERVAIIGPSGCGKSTILRLISGLIFADSGRVSVSGHVVTEDDDDTLGLVRDKIGLLFQSAALFDSMTVADNVGFSLIEQRYPPSEQKIRNRVQSVLEMVGMSGTEDLVPSKLSGGQKKRVGLARALVKRPEIMLYDEPTTGLDPVLSSNIEDLIVTLSKELGMASIVVTHQQSTMLRTPDKIYFMEIGRAHV